MLKAFSFTNLLAYIFPFNSMAFSYTGGSVLCYIASVVTLNARPTFNASYDFQFLEHAVSALTHTHTHTKRTVMVNYVPLLAYNLTI